MTTRDIIPSNNERDIEIASIIKEQLLFLNFNYYCSWGVSQTRVARIEDNPSLGILVNGFIHKGWVFISLTPEDLYDVWLVAPNNYKVTYKCKRGLMFDQLHEVIDGWVEKDPSWSDEEYSERVDKWLATQA